MSDKFEFYIASSSCDPGGIRYHGNVCLTDFHEACQFAMNYSPYEVLLCGWHMFVWHYKVVGDNVTLLNTFNMNDYVVGVLDKKGYFHSVDVNDKLVNKDKFGYPQHEQYGKLVYNEPTISELCNLCNNKVKKLNKGKEVFVTLPDRTKPHKFLVNHGYHWEDAPDLFDYEIHENPQTQTQTCNDRTSKDSLASNSTSINLGCQMYCEDYSSQINNFHTDEPDAYYFY